MLYAQPRRRASHAHALIAELSGRVIWSTGSSDHEAQVIGR